MSYIINPWEIEEKSMKIIEGLIHSENMPVNEKAVVHRIVHTSGDPQYAEIFRMSDDAVEAGRTALKNGCRVISDVNMVVTGINKAAAGKLGVEPKCFLSDPRVAPLAEETGETRSMTAFKLAKEEMNGSIVAIGNAPTALFKLLEMCRAGEVAPALIIGTPVGFVGAAESKDKLHEEAPVPYMTVLGTKGGSPIAASIINALMYSLVERK